MTVTIRPARGQSAADLARCLYELAGAGGRNAVRSAYGGFDVGEDLALAYLNRAADPPPPPVLPPPAPAPQDHPPSVDLPGHQPTPTPAVVADPPQRRTRKPTAARRSSDAV